MPSPGLLKVWDVGSGNSAITETRLGLENASALAFLGGPGLLIAHETGGSLQKWVFSKHAITVVISLPLV